MDFNFNPTFWYICRFCRCPFASTETLKEHKLACHLGECMGIKCIVFEERLLDTEWNPDDNFCEDENWTLTTNNENRNRSSHEEHKNKIQPDYDSGRESPFKNPFITLTRLTKEEINVSLNSSSCTKRQRNTRRAKQDEQSVLKSKIEEGQEFASASISPSAEEYQLLQLPQHELIYKAEPNPDTTTATDSTQFVPVEVFSPNDFNSNLLSMEVKVETYDFHESDTTSTVQRQTQEPDPELSESNQAQISPSLPSRRSRTATNGGVDKPFMCEICFSFFGSKRNLQQHMVCHSSIKPFKCSKCPMRFKRSGELSRHQIFHGKPTKYKCRFCSKPFSSNVSLVEHERTHTGDRPYKCPAANCKYAASTKATLTWHTRAAHSEELGLQQFVCPTCGKAYGKKSHLVCHIRTHQSV